jgi:hypothetical protein
MEAGKMLISTGIFVATLIVSAVICLLGVYVLKSSEKSRSLKVSAYMIIILALILLVGLIMGIATGGEVVSVTEESAIVRVTDNDYLLVISQGEFSDIREGDIVRFDGVSSPEGSIKYQIVSVERKIE